MKKSNLTIALLIAVFCVIALCACSNKTYTVKFDTVQGSAVADTQVVKGGRITFDGTWYKEPTREGYSFQGWRYEDGREFAPSDTISDNLTLYAVWEIKQYSLVVDANIENAGKVRSYLANDNAVSADKYDYDTQIVVEVENVYKGYDFMGWYDGDELCSTNEIYTFNLTAKDSTLTANFKVQDEFADYKFVSDENQLTITAYKGKNTVVSIPNGVDVIGKNAFSWRNNSSVESNVAMNITTVIIPQGVTSIGENAFASCSSLSQITIPNSVQNIGAYAFDGCKKLARVKIPQGVTTIEDGTFYDCNALSEVDIPSTVTEIGSSVFYLCKALTEIKIPMSVQKIKTHAFYMCGNSASPLVIKCQAASQPAGWADKWFAMGGTVEWGVND